MGWARERLRAVKRIARWICGPLIKIGWRHLPLVPEKRISNTKIVFMYWLIHKDYVVLSANVIDTGRRHGTKVGLYYGVVKLHRGYWAAVPLDGLNGRELDEKVSGNLIVEGEYLACNELSEAFEALQAFVLTKEAMEG